MAGRGLSLHDLFNVERVYSGRKTVPTGTAQPIGSGLCKGVWIKSSGSNPGDIWIGEEGVTPDTGFEMQAGDQLVFELSGDVNLVYCVTSGSDPHYLTYLRME